MQKYPQNFNFRIKTIKEEIYKTNTKTLIYNKLQIAYTK